ncbi:hypothetical protein PR048_000310 [Dryococelus australis]|uniref:HAT C-terminal dimerisation domain-containing protein n=1 Tax=Dryococelus australis TaxID=614101 RepID=A0ABQ9IEB6_9NEOP|nr:hypothetical protein PR048_000310 [Dryococelus australis]
MEVNKHYTLPTLLDPRFKPLADTAQNMLISKKSPLNALKKKGNSVSDHRREIVTKHSFTNKSGKNCWYICYRIRHGMSLKKVVTKFLSAPVGPASSKRLFSTAGLINTKLRSNFNSENVQHLVFLKNKNFALI